MLAVMQVPLNLSLPHLSLEEGFGEVQNTSLEVDHRREHFYGQVIYNPKALNEQLTKRQMHFLRITYIKVLNFENFSAIHQLHTNGIKDTIQKFILT